MALYYARYVIPWGIYKTLMYSGIIIKDFEANKCVCFSNLTKDYSDVIRRVSFTLSIEYEFFKAETKVCAEESDFLELKDGLQKMYQNESKIAVFYPIGDKFYIRFDLKETGQITVHVVLRNDMFTGNLEFEFITDQTAIPFILKDIENVID